MTSPDWSPFNVCALGTRADPTRPIDTLDGVGDRLRAAAFAEIQAREAFAWGADHFTDAPAPLRRGWRSLADAEDRHLRWLLARMAELGIDPAARKVSEQLFRSLRECKSAREFALFMASAEERGRKAGERFRDVLAKQDPVSARIFGKIALEEAGHIELARRFYPEAPRPDSVQPAIGTPTA